MKYQHIETMLLLESDTSELAPNLPLRRHSSSDVIEDSDNFEAPMPY